MDPDTPIIKEISESLIGSKLSFYYKIDFPNSTSSFSLLSNPNIIGDALEDIILPIILDSLPTFKPGPKQKSPDFYNADIYEWELKTFNITKTPCFDISNFMSFISQLNEPNGVLRKLFRTQYLIFGYDIEEEFVKITNFKLCSVWEILSYSGKYPLSLQSKRGVWYNLRPCSFFKMKESHKTKYKFINSLITAIKECPQNIEDKENIIKNIMTQFWKIEYSNIISDITV